MCGLITSPLASVTGDRSELSERPGHRSRSECPAGELTTRTSGSAPANSGSYLRRPAGNRDSWSRDRGHSRVLQQYLRPTRPWYFGLYQLFGCTMRPGAPDLYAWPVQFPYCAPATMLTICASPAMTRPRLLAGSSRLVDLNTRPRISVADHTAAFTGFLVGLGVEGETPAILGP